MRKVVQVLALVGGVGAAVLGVLAGALYSLLPWLRADGGLDTLPGFTVGGAFVALGCGLGLPLAWTAVRSLRSKPSRRLRWPRVWPLLLLWPLAALAGQLILSHAPMPWLFFPTFYVLSNVLPVVAVLSLVGRRLARGGLAVTWREILAQLGSGAFLGTTVALLLEMVLFLLLVLVATVIVALTPGGLELLQTFAAQAPPAGELPDLTPLLPLLRSPWLIGLALLGMAVVAPAAEEAVKTLGVVLMGYRRPEQSRAFLWGVSGGAGFALVEGLLNGALALGGQEAWAFTVVARGGTAVVHCLAGGLVGLGWQALRSGTRRWRGPAYYTAAVALHGLWNGLVGGLAFLQLLASQGTTGDTIQLLSTLGVPLVIGVLLSLLLGQFLLLLAISRRLGRALPDPEDAQDLAGLSEGA
jgi:RsiW-degrading membrane proteinase PrsW (M82 family)